MKNGWLDGAWELLFPSRANCMGCHSATGADEDWLCDACRAHLLPLRDWDVPLCRHCGRPLDEYGRCHTCRTWPEGVISAARCAYPYDEVVRSMIHALKYQGVYHMAEWMAGEMLCALYEMPGPLDALVPVPMYWKRRRTRGFNQAEKLAEALSEQSGLPVWPALKRVRSTPSQTRLTGAERRHNLENAFVVMQDVRGACLALVDDVLTTGATALACAQALKAAGAEEVKLVAMAVSMHG